ncbi:CCR4-NOT transcription complex subunit 1-like isoform X16 [Durio zibethinus]|uniref:CCR4-NOT transcription complex subunit 1-like isoform X16 n=1 Tax=Durio zibethinus TaxID=66656 RepID=A0A6P5XSC9_DURZI|nr:CCR4-NOT transcription complex subunit 1-like isoform X16 [Durio zibethinus]
MLQFSSLLSSHIRFLLQSLTDSNFVSVLRDLCQTLEYGIEGSILLLQTILYHMNLLGEDMQRKQYMSGLFSEVFSYLLDQPNFGTVCCEAFRNVIISKKFLQEFSNELQLSVSEKVALGLALADSENDEFRTIGQDFNIGLIQELCRNPASVDSVEEIQNIILFFYQSEGLTKYVDSFMQMLALMEPKERTSLILAPLLKDDVKEARFLRNLDMFHNFNENEFDSLLVEMESETSVSDIMREVGYRCTVNSTHCKEVLSNFLPLNEVTLSRILSTVAQSYSGLEDSQLSHSLFCSAIGSSAAFDISCPGSWNVDILVDSVNQLAPGIHWKIVMEYLDHEGFYIPNSQAFSFFMSIYARACQDPFPLHAVCNSVWKNVDGQLSFLRYAVSAPVEIFTFEHSVRKLAYVEACNRHELLSIQGNHAWLSLDLIDVLCQLAERGYANSVRAMLDYPLKHCPELLLLGISQICTAYNLLQHDVSSAIFPMVVENSVGSLILYLWHSNSKFVAHGLVHMIKADQSSIIRMLGICYEQKILSSFLEQIPFSCSIRLAVLASQEEYLCLEKWLNDNLNDYKDIFAEECLKFFKEISLDAAEDMSHDLFQSPGVVENIYFKTSSTFIKVFRANTEHITSDHIAEELERMNRASMHVKPRLQNVGTSDSSNLYGYADDIEAEADSYLSQIFYSQMPINVMIHMLSKLKESSEKREQLIFDHVIQNLLDEYRFFPRYPEKQLKIVAILFGSLIKHRLVNNLNLGIALRSVLDALRKPTDSKLFVFGTKALEQFVDRLVELPQYCSLILQISHLRGMHPELVDFAESALAWISSSCLEKDEDNTYVIYPQDDSTAAASKNLKLPGVMTRQPSHQLSPSQQMEQRLEEVIGDRIKASMTSSICMKPLLPQSAHPSNGFLNDVASSQKTVLSQNTIMAVPSTAPDFPHSRGVTSTRFGSALNIGTLVAAAEKRNTLVEETLHTSLSCQLRNSFQGLNVPNEHLEQAVALVINDNLDFGCAVIQHAASVKAVQSIDCEITRQLSLRRKNREGIDRSYYDANINAQGPKTVISESQLPRPGQSSHSQQQVYEDFVHFSWRNQVGQNSNVVPASLPASSGASVSSTLSCPQFPSAGQLNHGPYLSGNEPAGLDGVNYPLDLISVEIDSNQFLSSSSTSIGATDDINLLAANQSSVSSLCPIAAAPEVHSEEVPYARKELRPTAESLPTAPIDQLGSGISEPLLSMSDVLEKYQIISQKLDMLVSKESGEAEIHRVVFQIPKIILKCVSQDEAALAIAQKVFKSLYENASNSSHVGSHISIIAAIRDVCKLVVKEVTSWVIYSDEDRKFNTNITFGLMRKGLLNLAEYNKHMAKLIDSGKNKTATEFAISLLETLLVQESSLTLSELPNLIDSLAKLAARPGAPESLQKLVEIAKNPPENAASPSGNIVGKNARDKKSSDHSVTIMDGNVNAESTGVDLAGFYDQVSVLFSEWYHTYIHHGANDAPCAYFVSKLQQSGFLNGDDTSDKFFRFLMEHSVAHCLSSERIGSSLTFQSPQTAQDLSFLLVDVYAKLVVVILKQYLATDHLLSKIFQLTVRVIQRKAEEKKASFNPRPYFRLFVNWLLDLVSPHAVLDGAKFQVLIAFADTFHALQPLKVPAFSFAWLELISHKSFMPKLLTVNAPSGWVCAQLLLVDLLKFMEPYLRNAKLEVPIRLLYKGTLRLLLVLMHDFPEFLCNYHFSFCDVIPSSCIQMRNIILSAHPSNMQLPDPSTPNLKIDLLPDVHIAPHVFSEVDAALGAKQMKYDVDEYLKTTRQAFPFLSELKKKLLLPQNEAAAQAGTRYNVPLINSLILYVGMQTIQQLPKKNTPALAQQMTCNGPMESYIMGPLLALFQTLIVELDAEGCYLVLNAIANQLRHPSSHTHLYSYAMLYLFNEAKQETIKEQITRVLVERLMVNKPHPWGVKITFLELIKNPQYNFWSHAFIKCSPEIEKMVKTISI